MLRFCRFTGLRPSEAIALTKSDLVERNFTFRDFETNEVITANGFLVLLTKRIGSSKTERNVNVPLKNESSYRVIPIVNVNDVAETNAILDFTRSNMLFGDYYGNVIPTRKISDFIRRVRNAFNEKTGRNVDIYPYLMRKTVGSDHRNNHVSRAVTMDMMGQVNETTVDRFYSTAYDEGLLNASYHRKYLHNDQSGQLKFPEDEISQESNNESERNDAKNGKKDEV